MLKRALLLAALLMQLSPSPAGAQDTGQGLMQQPSPSPAGAQDTGQGLMQLKAGAVDTSPHFKELHLAPSTCEAPCLDFALSAELENDWIFAATPNSLKSNTLFPTLESVLIFAPVNHVRLIGDFIFEPVIDPQPGQSTYFKDLGAYVYQLFAEFEYGPFNVQVGKIHPSFGQAWDVTPGIHGADIPGNYELEERWGIGGAYDFDALGFDNVFQATIFTTDRTPLSGSIFTHRPRLKLSDGGAGNTKGVSSVSVTLDGCVRGAPIDCYAEGDVGYNLGFRYQRPGQGDTAGELGFVAGANKTLIFDEKTVRLFAEAAYFQHFEGSKDNALFLTGSGELDIGQWSYSLAYTLQQNLSGGTNQLAELAVGYNFGDWLSLAGEEWSVTAGYTFNRDNGQDIHLLGLLFTVDFNGSFPSATTKRGVKKLY